MISSKHALRHVRKEVLTSAFALTIVGALVGGILSACSGTSKSPLALLQLRGDITCLNSPAPTLGITRWDTPIGFTTDWYVNEGGRPVTITSVQLISPHGITLHRALVYEMVHARHVLYQAISWNDLGRGALPTAWAHRQPIPGAVIPVASSKQSQENADTTDGYYVVAEEITATTPAGGWALGEKLTYTSGGATFTIEAHTGIGIGSYTGPVADRCKSQVAYMKRAFGDKNGTQVGLA